LDVHENYNLDIVSVLYSVRCDIREHCFSKTGTTTYRPSCQFYEHLIDSGKARAISDCTKSKRMGVTAGLELKVAASDKILLGMQGSPSWVFSDSGAEHKSLCNALTLVALGIFGDMNNPDAHTIRRGLSTWIEC
jgi:hypothetical protein